MTTPANGSATSNSRDALHRLEADASRLMNELSGLTRTLRELGETAPDDLRQAALDAAQRQMQAVSDGINRLSAEAPQVIAKLDKQVRANPYAFILGALGVGWLLGKLFRSSAR